jgi:hypothetical protein
MSAATNLRALGLCKDLKYKKYILWTLKLLYDTQKFDCTFHVGTKPKAGYDVIITDSEL